MDNSLAIALSQRNGTRGGEMERDGAAQPAFVKKTQNAPRRDRTCAAASKGDHMTIPFEKLKAPLLANPKVTAARRPCSRMVRMRWGACMRSATCRS
jgi:hypothetical protein